MKTKFVMILPALLVMFLLINCRSSSKINTKTNKQGEKRVVVAIDTPLQDTYWKLITLGEKSIDTSKNKEMYILFRSENNRAEGNGGCNSFAGPYQLKGDSSVVLGELASTRMYCAGIENENAFFMALSATDHFQIHDDTLILSKGRAVELAKFVAVKRVKDHKAL
jgi:heat shock protein HslJ